jgi:hypothetical protein
MGRPRAGTGQPAAPGWGSRLALILFILFILTLLTPVVTLIITLLVQD